MRITLLTTRAIVGRIAMLFHGMRVIFARFNRANGTYVKCRSLTSSVSQNRVLRASTLINIHILTSSSCSHALLHDAESRDGISIAARGKDVVTNDGEEADVVVEEKSFRVRGFCTFFTSDTESRDGRCRRVYKRKSNQRETGAGKIESALRVCDRAS